MILEDLQARLRSVARPNENPEALLESLLTMAVDEFVAQREREAARWESARIQAQIDLMGPHRSHESSMTEAYRRLGITPSRDCSLEELEREADALLDALPPEKIAELERLGLL